MILSTTGGCRQNHIVPLSTTPCCRQKYDMILSTTGGCRLGYDVIVSTTRLCRQVFIVKSISKSLLCTFWVDITMIKKTEILRKLSI